MSQPAPPVFFFFFCTNDEIKKLCLTWAVRPRHTDQMTSERLIQKALIHSSTVTNASVTEPAGGGRILKTNELREIKPGSPRETLKGSEIKAGRKAESYFETCHCATVITEGIHLQKPQQKPLKNFSVHNWHKQTTDST